MKKKKTKQEKANNKKKQMKTIHKTRANRKKKTK